MIKYVRIVIQNIFHIHNVHVKLVSEAIYIFSACCNDNYRVYHDVFNNKICLFLGDSIQELKTKVAQTCDTPPPPL